MLCPSFQRLRLLALLASASFAACSVDSRDIADEPLLATGGSSASSMNGAGASAGAASGSSANGTNSNPGSAERASGAPFIGGATAAESDAGAAPSSDAGAPAAPISGVIVVSGQVVDFYRRPVPNVPVTIGQTTVASDARGQFSIADVAAPYTASLLATYPSGAGTARYGYVYEGLTRTDPTLQIQRGLVERNADFTASIDGADFSDANREAIFAFATPDGSTRAQLDSALGTYTASWTGPTSLTGTAHALLVLRSGTFKEPPVAYEAHQATTFAVSTGVATNIAFDLSPSSIALANVSGSVSGGFSDRGSNLVSLRFADGTVLPLLDDTQRTAAFSYLVPVLPGASLSVAASSGATAPFSLVHRENIAPGQTGVALAIPGPVTLGSPPLGAEVTAATPFTWSSPAQAARTFVWHLEYTDTVQGLFVLTSRTQLTLAELADGFGVPPNTDVYWSVETHGAAPDVDAATGPSGFLDSYVELGDVPDGPTLRDGSFTRSEERAFTVSP